MASGLRRLTVGFEVGVDAFMSALAVMVSLVLFFY